MSFYNTIQATGEQLDLYSKKAKSQEDLVKELFYSERKPMTAAEVFNKLVQLGWLSDKAREGSIRRCCTDLMNAGLLVKTKDMTQGNCGSPNHKYQLVNTIKQAC